MVVELWSCYPLKGKKDRYVPIAFNMSLDRTIINLETCMIAKYAFDNYPDTELGGKNTLIQSDSVMKKYCFVEKKKGKKAGTGNKPDNSSDTRKTTEELIFRDVGEGTGVMGRDDYRTIKKCSDILAFIEFYLNRLTSLNDDRIKNNMMSSRHLLAHSADFRNPSALEDKSFKDIPLLFKAEGKTKTDEPHDEICNVSSDILGRNDNYRKDKRNIFFFDQLSSLDEDNHVGFGDLLDTIDGERYDLFVSLKGSLPREISEAYEDYWKGKEYCFDPGDRMIPLNVLINCLLDCYKGQDSGFAHQMGYVIGRDETDFKYDVVSPLNPLTGHIRPRDDDFETSHSLTSKIYRYAPEYSRDVIRYARILHGIIMGSDVRQSSKKEMILLSFEPSKDLLRLMNPVLFDRNYPISLVFDKGSRSHMEDYMGYLNGHGYSVGKLSKSGRITIKRDNRSNIIGIDWPDTRGNSYNIWERNAEQTPITLIYVRNNDPQVLKGIVTSESKNNQTIVVTNQDSIVEAEEMISAAGSEFENIQYLAVFGDKEYMSIRYDFHNIVEVGIKDCGSLYRIHRNGLEQRRLNAVDSVLDAVEDDRSLPKVKDLKDRLDTAEGIAKGDSLQDIMLRSFIDGVRSTFDITDGTVRL